MTDKLIPSTRGRSESLFNEIDKTLSDVERSLGEINEILGNLPIGIAARTEFERLARRTDAALAEEGVTREEAARRIYQRYFG